MVSTRPVSRMTMPLPARSWPSVPAVKASAGISASILTTERRVRSRSNSTSSGRGCCASGTSQWGLSTMARYSLLLHWVK